MSQRRAGEDGGEDAVTGLPGRRAFLAAAAELTAVSDHSAAHRGSCSSGVVALFVVDLDRFSLVNALWGHEEGDALMRVMSKRLAVAAGPGAVIGRVGGDQFGVVMRAPSAGTILSQARALADAVAAPLDVGGRRSRTTACVGYSVLRSSDVAMCLQEATIAVRQAKARGLNTVLAYDDQAIETNKRRYLLEHGLSTAVAKEELRLVFQPEVDLRTGDVLGVEALLRWHHPVLGMVSPAQFVHVAESSGLIVGIGTWVIDAAAAQAAVWRDALDGGPLPVWVNLSAAQLSDSMGLLAVIDRALDEHGIGPESIGVEVTETALMVDVDASRLTLRRLRDRGIEIAVDDFGSGYASFVYLRDLPASVLKIDRSFISAVGGPVRDPSIVEAIIDLGHTLRMKVVAEGVETTSQAAGLIRLGADRAQGYLFARPLDPDGILPVVDRPWCGVTIVDDSGLTAVRKVSLPGVPQRRAAMLVSALDATNDAVLIADCTGTEAVAVYANAAFERATGVSTAELRGRPLWTVLRGEEAMVARNDLDTALELKRPTTIEVPHRRAPDQLVWLEITLGPLRDDDSGDVSHWMCVLRDVTARKTLETEASRRAEFDLFAADVARRLLSADRSEPIGPVYGVLTDLGSLLGVDDVVLDVDPEQAGHRPGAGFEAHLRWSRRSDLGTSALSGLPTLDRRFERVLAADDVVVVDDLGRLVPGQQGLAVQSLLAAPVHGASGVRGVLSVRRTQPHAWSRAEANLVREIGDLLAQAVDRARSIVDLRRAAAFDAFRHRVARRAMTADGEAFTAMLDIAAEELAELLGITGVYVESIDLSSGEVEVLGGWQAPSLDRRSPPPAGRSLLQLPEYADALSRLRPLRCDDHEHTPHRWMAERQQVLGATPARASVVVPLVVAGELVGVLGVEHRDAKGWSEPEIGLLENLADTLAAALVHVRTMTAVRASEQRFRALAELSSDMISLLDVDGRVTYVSPASGTLLGYLPEELAGRRLLDLVHPDDQAEFVDQLHRAARSAGALRTSGRLRRADGAWPWIDSALQPVRSERGVLTGWQVTSRDVTERRVVEEELARLALYDPLTNAANRVLLNEHLKLAIERQQRSGTPYALLAVDLDGFKYVNDQFGHAGGDQALQAVARRLRAAVRQSDTVARVGGDEFVVLCTETDRTGALRAAERIVESLGRPIAVEGGSASVGASVGVVTGAPGEERDEVMRRADRAMYEAKRAGKGRVQIY